MSQFHKILLESGFRPVSATNRVVHDSIKAAFDYFGESTAEALIYHLAESHRMPKEAVLTRYDLVEKSIKVVFGYGADSIIDKIRQNLLKAMPDANPKLSPMEIIDRSHKLEVLDLLRSIGEHEHVVFIHSDDKVDDQILNAFLNPSFKGSKGIIWSKERSIDSAVLAIGYDEMLHTDDKSDSMKKLSNWISNLRSKDYGRGTRMAGEDDGWFFRNGFGDEIVSLEQVLGPQVKDKLSILCTYKLTDLSEAHLKKIAEAHSYVITDDPVMIYKSGGGVILSCVMC